MLVYELPSYKSDEANTQTSYKSSALCALRLKNFQYFLFKKIW